MTRSKHAAKKATTAQKPAIAKKPSTTKKPAATTKPAATKIPAATTKTAASRKARAGAKVATSKKPATGPRLLSGGNPQIAKGDGDAPVQAFIAAMPGWKRDVGRRIDALVVRAVPGVQKAVKWNSPFYGTKGQGWFLAFHCITKYVKVAFFRGTQLRPVPPGESTQKHVRYFHIYEGDAIDEAQFVAWVKQASALPGERM